MGRHGLYIALVGTDGSGKTTLLTKTVKALRKKGLKVRMESGNRFRFQVLPLNTLITPDNSASDRPPQATLPRRPNAIMRFVASVVYGIEYTLRYHLRIRPALKKNDVVIMDRGYIDLYTTPNTNHLVSRAFEHLFKSPRYVFLHHDLSTLAARRPDHDPKDLARQLRAYRTLSTRYWTSLKTDKTSEETLLQLITSALEGHKKRRG